MLPRKYNKVCSSATRTWANRSNSLELTRAKTRLSGRQSSSEPNVPGRLSRRIAAVSSNQLRQKCGRTRDSWEGRHPEME